MSSAKDIPRTNPLKIDLSFGNWRSLAMLPAIFMERPMAEVPDSSVQLPLEQLIPMFMNFYMINFQNVIMQMYTPAIAVLKSEKKLTMVTHNKITNAKVPTTVKFASFKDFYDGRFGGNSKEEDKLSAYLCLSMFGKCTQIATCFGLLILKVLKTHKVTFENEKIIGWVHQEGSIDWNHPSIYNLQIVDIAEPNQLPRVLTDLRNGVESPVGATNMRMGRNKDHVWLTFVTESGRIFDLDLSSFQFGNITPFPCIVPVVPTDPKAFNGLVDRESIMNDDVKDFTRITFDLIDLHVNMLNGLKGNDAVKSNTFISGYNSVVNHMLTLLPRMLPEYASPAHFWDTIKTYEIR